MRQSCLKALLPVVALTMACHESVAPPKQPALFVLETFNNQPLPAIIGAGGGETTTLLFASLFLDGAASATIITHSHQVSLSSPPRDAADTARYSYRIVGDSIAFTYSTPCPINALCVMPPFGIVTSSTVTLFYGGSPSSRPIYFYRAIELMPAL
jgi:hypothetical protein